MIRLSLILCTFNVEKYIEKCIRSLENQHLDTYEYEIIVVNDGSTDRSREIVNSLKSEFSNIVLMDKANGGLSSARNMGISSARGDYIMFCDPDDYLDENTLGEMLQIAEKRSLEGCCFNLKQTSFSGTRIIDNYQFRESDIMDGITFFQKGFIHGYTVTWIMNRQFIIENELFFVEGVSLAEDLEFMIRFACLAKRVQYYNLAAYNYIVRHGSLAMSSRKMENIYYVFPLIQSLKKFKDSKIKDEKQLNFIEERIACHFQDAINFVTYPKFIKYFPIVKKEIRKHGKLSYDTRKFMSWRKNELSLMKRSITVYFIYALIRVNISLLVAKLKIILASKRRL